MPGLTGSHVGRPLFEDEHDAYRESFATFLARAVAPAYGEWQRAGGVPRDLLRAAGEHGYLGMRVPEEHGGAGVDDLRFGVVVGEEAMRTGVHGLALVLTAHNDVAVPALLAHAPDERRAEWAPGLASGDVLATVLNGDVRVQAQGGAALLDGTAALVVNGTQADLFVVAAQIAEDPERSQLVVVERDARGLSIEPSEPPIGLQAAGLADVRLEGTPGLALGAGDAPARELAIDQALSLAVMARAGALAALATTVAYVQERKAFGQPIADFQNTRQALAAVSADLDAAGALIDTCVRRRLDGTLDARGAAAAKLHCSELYGRAVDTGVQLHGGYGYIMEYPIAHAYADARFWRLHGGTSEQLREIVANALFERPRS